MNSKFFKIFLKTKRKIVLNNALISLALLVEKLQKMTSL